MLLKTIQKLRKKGKKIGFTASTFDFLHAGHVLMLEESRNNCDFLIVGLMTDPTIDRPDIKNKPVQTTLERWLQAQSLQQIDLLIPLDTERDLFNLLQIINPDIRFVGEEYVNDNFTGSDLDIQIFYNKRMHDYSSTQIRTKLTSQATKK
jgi:glycerol-3-phosphate cytidylyltransferase